MNRLSAFASSSLLVPLAVAACGSTGLVLSSQSDGGLDGGPPDATPSGQTDDANTDAGRPDDASDANDALACDTPDAWAISVIGLRSQGCKTAADCVAVYIGDDACETDHAHGGHCPNYAISKDSYAEYQSRYEAINAACRSVCGIGSINCANVPVFCDMQGVSGPNCEVCHAVDGGPCTP